MDMPEAIKAYVEDYLKKQVSSMDKPRRNGKSKGREAPSPEVTAARMAANDAECIKVFTAAGFEDVQPRVNVLTYGKPEEVFTLPDGTTETRPAKGWIAKGRKVKAGEKAHRVSNFNLFHIDQTEELPA